MSDNALEASDTCLGTITGLPASFSLPLSFAFTLDTTAEELYKITGSGSSTGLVLFNTSGAVWSSPFQYYGITFHIYRTSATATDLRLMVQFGKKDSTPATRRQAYFVNFPPTDGKHTYVVTIGDAFSAGVYTPVNFYVDGVAETSIKNLGNLTEGNYFEQTATGKFHCLNNYSSTNNPSAVQGTFSRLMLLNIDMSATGAVYTVDDYINGRDVPASANPIVNFQNDLTATEWHDESGNGYNMALSGGCEVKEV